MKVIVRPRQCGKTTELVEFASEYGYTILAHNRLTIQRIKEIARKLGLDIEEPLYWNNGNLDNQMCSRTIKGIVIDNVEFILDDVFEYLRPYVSGCGRPVKGFTVSGVNGFEYDEREDSNMYLKFQRTNPDLTFDEFNRMKYGNKWKQ